MIRSIRRFLLISLLAAITIASSVTAIGNYVLDKKIIQPYLDGELMKNLDFINAINKLTNNKKTVPYLKLTTLPHFLYQVWNNNGQRLLSSTNSTDLSLKNAPIGFSDIEFEKSDWRVYAEIDPVTQNKIVVAELYEIRNVLADSITRNNAYILLITYPFFGLVIWIIVGVAFRSVTRVTTEIANRASTYLEPVDANFVPIEIKPLVTELNQLFIRLKLAFNRNKRFAADAAHELRTPLAALKTQAQVALKMDNKAEQHNALLKVIQGVDRSTHVVAQLLTLSRLSQEKTLNDLHPLNLHKLAAEIIAYLVPIALEKNIEIELIPPPADSMIIGNDIAIGILIRNVVDNAIRYTPSGGTVTISILNEEDKIIFRVVDTGPGIPEELRERVFERFFRILGTSAAGSGLGLAIVNQIAELHYAKIFLSSPPNGIGLQLSIAFNKIK
jgi:two-component system, OmpR family, sensor histidine kinase QseC